MKDINRENSMCIERYLDVRTRRCHRRRRHRHHVHLIEHITYRRDFSVVLDLHTHTHTKETTRANYITSN